MMANYDVIVIGCGGVGSAAAFHLAARGAGVLALDRFAPPHDQGSSHGHTRMIRQAYCEHPNYVPLVQRAYALWAELQDRHGQQLYYEVGLLEVGPPDGLVVPGVLRSAAQHHLPIDRLEERDVARRFPGFRLPPQTTAVFEQRAGYLLVEQCVAACQAEAARCGADLQAGHIVESWHRDGKHLQVRTNRGQFSAERLIVAAGAWAGPLLRLGHVPLTVLRKCQNWFACRDPRYSATQGCPAFLFELPEGIFYGFPQIDGRGVKAAEHTGGVAIPDPAHVDRSVDVPQRARVAQMLKTCLPGVGGPATDHSVCLYTMSPDGHFLVDRHPHDDHVFFAAGLSGHGFKFAPVLGQVLADWALEGTTSLPVQFLGCQRLR